MSNDDITKQLPEILSRVLVQMDTIISRVVTVEQSVNSGFTELGNRMEALETKVDECLHDTRPMWKALQTQITELQSQIAGLREEMKEGFIKIESRLDALSIEFNKLGGKLLLYDRRLASLESKPS